jgi:membrane protease YdiL (CAAX protease family)
MLWLAAVPVGILTGALFLPGGFHTANAAYHVWCGVLIYLRRERLRGRWGWSGRVRAWTIGTGAVSAAGLLGAILWVPRDVWVSGAARVLPASNPVLFFVLFGLASFFLHVPLEEVYWRGVILGPGRWSGSVNTVFFYLLHAAPMSVLFGSIGWALGLPAAAAGAAWAFVTRRTGSLWPALLAHFVVVGLLLMSALAVLFPDV